MIITTNIIKITDMGTLIMDRHIDTVMGIINRVIFIHFLKYQLKEEASSTDSELIVKAEFSKFSFCASDFPLFLVVILGKHMVSIFKISNLLVKRADSCIHFL
jgi:hypothetical protein